MSNSLPERPNLDHLREQAKDLLTAFHKGDSAAIGRFLSHLPALAGKSTAEAARAPLALHDAQSVVAREYGLPSWSALISDVELKRSLLGITPEVANAFIDLAMSNDPARIRRQLELYPGLPSYNPVCGLVCGDPATVLPWLDADPARATAPLPPNGWTPIEYVAYSWVHRVRGAAYTGLEQIGKALLERGANPNASHPYDNEAPEGTGLSVLYGASGWSGHIGLVRLLLERGANPNDGESIYHSAEHNRRDILQLLVDHGGDVSTEDPNWGNAPVYFLMGYRETDQNSQTALAGVEWLLEHGADPNCVCTPEKETALHAACRTGHGAATIELLLRFGADPLKARGDGRRPYQLAVSIGNTAAAQVLADHGGRVDLDMTSQFMAACSAGETSNAKRLLDALPEVRDGASELLAKLAELGVAAGVRTMLELGFDVTARSMHGATPLHWACFCGQYDCAQLLLDAGSPLEVLDADYQATPLGWATHGSTHNRNPHGRYPEIVEAIIRAGMPVETVKRELDHDSLPDDVREAIQSGLGRLEGYVPPLTRRP